MRKQIFSLLLSMVMLFSLCSNSVLAAGNGMVNGLSTGSNGLCEHHSVHNADCGYTDETPCGYICLICGSQNNDINSTTECSSTNSPDGKHHGTANNYNYIDCTSPGECFFICEYCNDNIRMDIPAQGHDWSKCDGKCNRDGCDVECNHRILSDDGVDVSAWINDVCTVCGKIYSADSLSKPIVAVAHFYDDGKVTKELTCTESGSITYTCKICVDKDIRTLCALNHNYRINIDIDGKAVVGCSRCDAEFIKPETVKSNKLHSSGTSSETKLELLKINNNEMGLIIRQEQSRLGVNQTIKIMSEEKHISYVGFELLDKNGSSIQTIDLNSDVGVGNITFDIMNGTDGGRIIDITKDNHRLDICGVNTQIINTDEKISRSAIFEWKKDDESDEMQDIGGSLTLRKNIVDSTDDESENKSKPESNDNIQNNNLFSSGILDYGVTRTFGENGQLQIDNTAVNITQDNNIIGSILTYNIEPWAFWTGSQFQSGGAVVNISNQSDNPFNSGTSDNEKPWSSWTIGQINANDTDNADNSNINANNGDLMINNTELIIDKLNVVNAPSFNNSICPADIPAGYTLELIEEMSSVSGLSVRNILDLLDKGATIVRMGNGLFIQMGEDTGSTSESDSEYTDTHEPTDALSSTDMSASTSEENDLSSDIEIVFETKTLYDEKTNIIQEYTGGDSIIVEYDDADENLHIVEFEDDSSMVIKAFVDLSQNEYSLERQSEYKREPEYIPPILTKHDPILQTWKCDICGKEYKRASYTGISKHYLAKHHRHFDRRRLEYV